MPFNRGETFMHLGLNLRGCHFLDVHNTWDERKLLVEKLLNYYRPNIICAQECQEENLTFLEQTMINYDGYTGLVTGTDNYNPILWRGTRFEPVMHGGCYLSENPEVALTSWGSKSPRSLTWVLFQDRFLKKTYVQSKLLVVNTHLDNVSREARIEQTKLLLTTIAELREQYGLLRIIVHADWNSNPCSYYHHGASCGTLPHQLMIQAGYRDTYNETNVESFYIKDSYTFHRFQGENYNAFASHGMARIDRTYVYGAMHSLHTEIIRKPLLIQLTLPDTYVSDHYPVLSVLRYL